MYNHRIKQNTCVLPMICIGAKMIISRLEIEQFRMMKNQSFDLGEDITAIVGQNGTMKSTLLGMIGEPFRFQDTKDSDGGSYTTIDGKQFQLKFSDAFKFSDGPGGKERAGDHVWYAVIDPAIFPDVRYRAFTAPRGSIAENSIRTWAGANKASGQKHAQVPVIYLSLKRLIPIGEERKIVHNPISLTAEESAFFEKHHRNILLLSQKMEQVEFVTSANKSTLGFVTEKYDSLTNSAGQDNVGKLLLAILSFMRLKKALGGDYKGGLLLVDEIDATLYPAAQIQMVRSLLRFCHSLQLQVVFTTHSPDILRALYTEEAARTCKVLYLETRDEETFIYENLPLKMMLAHLRAEAVSEHVRKVKVFSEDESTRIFLKALLPSALKKRLDIVDVSLSEGTLNSLRKAKLPDFLESVIVYDGDINVNAPKYKADNSVALPGGYAPEVVFFKFLKGLSEKDEFWSPQPGGYTHQICFKGFESENGSVEQAKKWFRREKTTFGRGCTKLVRRWEKDNTSEAEAFRASFLAAFKSVGGSF